MKPLYIFDFDGTIADTMAIIGALFNQLAEEFGYPAVNEDQLKRLRQSSWQEIRAHLNVPLYRIPRIVNRGRELMRKRFADLNPVPEMKLVLRALRGSGDLGILTSNSKEYVTDFLGRHDLAMFDFIRTSKMLGGKRRCLAKIQKELGLSYDRLYYVGDETRDIEATQRLPVTSVAVTWGFNSPEALARFEPDHLFREPRNLLGLCN